MSETKPRTGGRKPGRAKKPAYHHGDLRAALIAAARALLETEGVAGTTLRAAARKAGVSQTAPYHHFTDKNALLAAAAAQGYVEFDNLMRAMMAAAPAGDPQAQLFESGVAYVKFATAHPGLFKLMFGSAIENRDSFPELAEAGERAFQTLLTNVAAVMERSGGDENAAMTTALSVWSRVHGLATLIVDGGLNPKRFSGASPEALARAVLAAPVLET